MLKKKINEDYERDELKNFGDEVEKTCCVEMIELLVIKDDSL
jgi:hypothetical protein